MGEILYAGSIHRIEQAKIDAARLTQAAKNERSGAESALARFSADLGNKRRMDAAGQQIARIEMNMAKNADAKASGDLNTQIALAEELGRSTTMASAAGVGGSSVEAYNRTVKLRAAMGQEQSDRAYNSDMWAAGQDKGTTLTNAVAGLDNNAYRANLDYTQYVDHSKMGIFQRVATLGIAAAATYFGGPQAGMAVIGVSESMQAAKNGNFAAASQGMTQAVQNGVGGFQAARETGGQGFWNASKASPLPQINATATASAYNPLWDSTARNGGYGGGYTFKG